MMVTTSRPQYISVSRRTDMPRFYADAFFRAWQQGEVTYDGGYGRSYTVSLRPPDVMGYIFWSKDFALFNRHPSLPVLLRQNNALFHYTLNHCPDLEPALPPLAVRLDSMRRLVDRVGPERVLWRFDPLCRYQLPGEAVRDNVASFWRLLPAIAAMGINRCYFSFMTAYAKLKGRRRIRFLPFEPAARTATTLAMARAAAEVGITLYNCCNSDICETVPAVRQASCIDNGLLAATDSFGVHQPLRAKPSRKGCGCFASRDIGSYSQQCGHGCLYCYANPVIRCG